MTNSSDARASRLARRNAELIAVLRAIKEFAEGHHADQEPHYLLHALQVDIPDMCERAIGPDVLLRSRCPNCKGYGCGDCGWEGER